MSEAFHRGMAGMVRRSHFAPGLSPRSPHSSRKGKTAMEWPSKLKALSDVPSQVKVTTVIAVAALVLALVAVGVTLANVASVKGVNRAN